jgi:sec-independent protein translocase protein TatA
MEMVQSLLAQSVWVPDLGTVLIAWGAPSFQELIVILVIVLIVFGAKRLPELARALGQSMNEFRKAKDEFEKELHKSSASNKPAEGKNLPTPRPASQTEPSPSEKSPPSSEDRPS